MTQLADAATNAGRERLGQVMHRTMAYNYRLWGFGEGIGLRGILAAGDILGDTAAEAFVHGLFRAWLGRGVGRSAEDHVAPGRELLEFYQRKGGAEFLEGARALAALNAGFPKGRTGARLHRTDQPGWRQQIWVDCMDVDGPFLARLARITGEERYIVQALEELLGYARALQDEATGLMWHGHEEDCGTNGQLWARGNGWALMGLVDSLIVLPSSFDGLAELRERLVALVEGLQKLQRDDGLWHTILTDPESYPESTLAAMAAHALHDAFAHDLLSRGRYGRVQSSARAALPSLVDEGGVLQLVSVATPVGEAKGYATRPFGIFPWGQGPLLLALAQEPT